MTRVEFDENLAKIDFTDGINSSSLENYLLACLFQLEIYKDETPSYELFLSIFDQARNSQKVVFELYWKEQYSPEKKWIEYEWNNLTEWERAVHELRSLTTDLIHTRELRSQPDYLERKMLYEWDTEGGVRFYNGTTPGSILGYAATRFEGEYSHQAYEEIDLSWQSFTDPLWIGISYE